MSNFTKLMAQAAAGNAGGGDFYPYTVNNSVRFNNDDSAYLYRTPSSAGNRKTWTYSCWVKRASSGDHYLFSAHSANTDAGFLGLRFKNTDELQSLGWFSGWITSDALYRDFSAWMHVLFSVDTTQATADDRFKLYVNGTQITDYTSTAFTQNSDTIINSTAQHRIGNDNSTGYLDGYLSQVALVDGQALTPSSFGESKNGVWVPKNLSGLTFGTNGFYLDFADSSNLGNDVSGNNNDFTSSGLTSSDQMVDTPTNNFMVGNPLVAYTSNSQFMREGNLEAHCWDQINYGQGLPQSGKWYFELQGVNTYSAGGYVLYPGVVVGLPSSSQNNWSSDGLTQLVYMIFNNPQQPSRVYSNGAWSNTSSQGASGSIPNNTVIGFAIDMDNGQIDSYVGGTLDHQLTLTSAQLATKDVRLVMQGASNTGVYNIMDLNFGQNGTFNGRKTAQGNSDENGYGDFYYTPPTGYLAVCSQNMPEPTIGPNSATQADEHFNTVLWTGNGSTQAITGVGFQPDFTWIKVRDAVNSHYLFDAVRGADLALFSDSSSAETDYTATGRMTSFDTDGFSVKYSSSTGTNASGNTYVGWNWKANGSGSSNTDGSITSTVSANTDAGISIVTYTGNATAGATVGHGLSSAPELVFFKNRGYAYSWLVQGDALGSPASGYYMWLDRTDAVTTNSSVNTTFGGSTITLDNSPAYNQSGYNIVAYCFAEVEGFSKFGSYTGNGSSDGPFIYTGFRPAWFMIKNISTGGTGYDWIIHDTRRSIYNPSDTQLIANSTVIENRDSGNNSSTAEIDILSNGFKHRTSSGGRNLSGNTYIYMAFAENPFKYSNAR